MNDLTLEELKAVERWYRFAIRQAYLHDIDEETHEKIKQAIKDLEFEAERKPLNF